MSKARNLSDFISDPTISTTEIADLAVTHAKLHGTMDLSSKTVTLPTLSTLNTTGSVGIGTSSPATQASVQNSSTSLGLEIDTTSGFASGPTLRGYYRSSNSYKPIAMTGSTVHFGINDVEKMRIDSSGNVGIGDNITKTWSLGKALHIGNAENSLWGEGDYAFHLVQNGYYNGGWKYTHSDAATMYSQSDGGQYWYHAGNGAADNALTWTPTMRLDTSGNLLVGRTSNLAGARTLISGTKSGTNGTNGQLVILDEQSYNTTDNGGGISFAGDFYNGGQVVFATIQGVKANNTDANNAGALKFTTKANGANQVEAMRIDSGGNLIVGNAGVSFTSDRLQVKSPVGEPVASFYRPRNTAGGGLVRFMSDVGSTQTIVAQVTSEGNFVTNGGINFGGSVNSGGVTSSSNTLDDYEEGTWTPNFVGLTNTPGYYNLSGKYTKIGGIVHLQFFVQLSHNPAPTFTSQYDAILVSGVPFPCTNGSGYQYSQGVVAAQSFLWDQYTYGTYPTTGQIGCSVNHIAQMGFEVTGHGQIRSQVRNKSLIDSAAIIEASIVYKTNS